MVHQGVVGDTHTYTLVLPGGSTDGFATISASADDAAGNSGTDTDSTSLTIDNPAPGATITLTSPTPTGSDAVSIEVAFDEPVAPTFDSGDISLAGTLAGSVVVTGTDPTYTVTVTFTDPNADGTVGIDIAGGGAITDLAGNPYPGGSSGLYDIFNWRGFTVQPQDVRLYTGDSHTFSVVADCGASTLSYQWKWDDGAKTVHNVGPDAADYTIPDATGCAGDYWCEVDYDGATYVSGTASLDVRDPLQITVQPVGGACTAGDAHTFTVGVTGGYPPLSYTWEKDGVSVGTDPDCAIDPLETSHSGWYRVLVQDDNGAVAASDSVELTVDPGMPATQLLGLGLVVGGIALAGFIVARRKS